MKAKPESTIPAEVEFCLELGRCLQAFGTPAHRFEVTLLRICRRFGLQGQFALLTGLDTAFQMVFLAGAMLIGLLLANLMVRSKKLL